MFVEGGSSCTLPYGSHGLSLHVRGRPGHLCSRRGMRLRRVQRREPGCGLRAPRRRTRDLLQRRVQHGRPPHRLVQLRRVRQRLPRRGELRQRRVCRRIRHDAGVPHRYGLGAGDVRQLVVRRLRQRQLRRPSRRRSVRGGAGRRAGERASRSLLPRQLCLLVPRQSELRRVRRHLLPRNELRRGRPLGHVLGFRHRRLVHLVRAVGRALWRRRPVRGESSRTVTASCLSKGTFIPGRAPRTLVLPRTRTGVRSRT